MYKSASLLAIGVAVVALTGCATPRYETVHRYEPPVSEEGRACVASCEATRTQCRSDCQAAWAQCTAEVEPQVESHYAQALAEYADELRLYRMDLDRYEWELWLGWHHNYSGFWYSPWPGPWYASPWPGYYPPSAPPPGPPSREAVRAKLHKEQCRDDCGCEGQYDACFTACGGKRVTETRCTANCPQEK